MKTLSKGHYKKRKSAVTPSLLLMVNGMSLLKLLTFYY